MMAHQDVVPVEGQDWKHDPFGAEIIDGEIWGRGSLDTKCIVSAFLEAAEYLINQGFVPRAMSGTSPAMARKSPRSPAPTPFTGSASTTSIPTWCSTRVAPWQPTRPLGVTEPVAMVGVSEKGHVDFTVTARADGGHASTPAANDACRLLSRVCETISTSPGKPSLTPAVEATLTELGARSSALYKAVFGNLWLTRPRVTKIMAAVPETGAMIRTTYALTQIEGSTAHNVLPPVARANFNVRMAPFETIDDAVARARASPPRSARPAASRPTT